MRLKLFLFAVGFSLCFGGAQSVQASTLYVKKGDSSSGEGKSTIYNRDSERKSMSYGGKREPEREADSNARARQDSRQANIDQARRDADRAERQVQRQIEESRKALEKRLAEKERAYQERKRQEALAEARGGSQSVTRSSGTSGTGQSSSSQSQAPKRIYRGSSSSTGSGAGRIFSAR